MRRRGAASLLPLALALPIVPALLTKTAPSDTTWTVVLSGDTDGYLSPCGCTSPMQGGIRRRATALQGDGDIVRIDNGNLLQDSRRQSILKAEIGAQAVDLSRIDAVNLGEQDTRTGEGTAATLVRLSGGRMVSSAVRPNSTSPVQPWRTAGPFLIGGATANPSRMAQALREDVSSPEEAARRLAQEAAARGLAPILLFDGSREAAAGLARAEPALRLVTYRTTAHPPAELAREGSCALATPGERGKAVVRLTWREGTFVSSAVQDLGPEVADDPDAQRLFGWYLRELAQDHLLERAPHVDPRPYAGTARCVSCHAAAGAVWRKSGHAHALASLEKDGQAVDPECVPCHVVAHPGALAFRSRAITPNLANVGCESCHGAGEAHSAHPRAVRLPKLTRSACAPCHTLENSPNFDFSTYWPKIRHGFKP